MSASHTWFCCCCCWWCCWSCGSTDALFLPPDVLWSSSMRRARRMACLRRPISTVPFKPCRSVKNISIELYLLYNTRLSKSLSHNAYTWHVLIEDRLGQLYSNNENFIFTWATFIFLFPYTGQQLKRRCRKRVNSEKIKIRNIFIIIKKKMIYTVSIIQFFK